VVSYIGHYFKRSDWDLRDRGHYSWTVTDSDEEEIVLCAREYRNVSPSSCSMRSLTLSIGGRIRRALPLFYGCGLTNKL
jgi:hypothetical protein